MILSRLATVILEPLMVFQKRAAMVAEALQDTYEERRNPPLIFPTLEQPYEQLHRQYYFNIYYANQQEWMRRVGVCCLRKPVQFFVRTEGRAVILFDGDRFSAQWMTESEFRAAADSLGFGSLLED